MDNVTKGEWVFDGGRIRTNTTVIANPWCDSNYDHHEPDSNRYGEINANAHLIAAAPTHHELLVWIRDRVEHFGNLDIVRDEEIIERLTTEINKADGK